MKCKTLHTIEIYGQHKFALAKHSHHLRENYGIRTQVVIKAIF